MNFFKLNKISYLVFHVLLGLLVHFVGEFVFIYFAIFLALGTYWLIKNNDSDFQTLTLILYVVGLEILFRMRSEGSMYDIGKYSVIFFCILSFGHIRINLKAWPYLAILLLFIPGIVLTVNTFFFEIDVRKKIMFNLLGPFSLIFASLYTYNKRISLQRLNNILFIAAGPLVSILTLIIVYTPSNKEEVFTNTTSNFVTSGGFGPNQMSVVLGLGVFIFFTQFIFNSKEKIYSLVSLFLFFLFSYRGLITFSRGGMLTALAMVIVFCFTIFKLLNKKAKSKFLGVFSIILILSASAWLYSSYETGGLIDKRYKNKDAAGRVKESQMSGREDIMETDLKFFEENPIFGVGPGIGGMMRGEEGLQGMQAHSEPTRLLAEHGSFGLIILLMLIFVPIIKYFRFRQYHHLYFFPFLIFWGLTINHAATRIVAPGVLYALTLLNVYIQNDEDEDTVSRK
ncbi:O-antigen ligase family protein [Flavobacterium urocaniciphilum]|uniref:O-Antigen ligase n=1 Tax=Flavobacterium urocaniciphilum TaxID=1299341 RepID=A0A1H8YRW0_9FLAO|nr:O-antigen ligase family protein [Flavobacterium urocaniciphilum]SEP54955.1 O-Antigen ligase [Flavobacterium urocaniciphilum]